ncbi:MAG: hypothetical protein IT164_05265 [Bryobacterales bacterium]|nr:hypothetical protein [Bryobacterales bacterium]
MRIESSVVQFGVQRSYAESRQVADEAVIRRRMRPSPEPSRERSGNAEACEGRRCQQVAGERGEAAGSRAHLAKLVARRMWGGHHDEQGPSRRAAESAPHRETETSGRPRWEVSLRHREVYEERENLLITARGAIRTADGREFSFDAAFSLARSFRVEAGSALKATGEDQQLSGALFLDRGGVSRLLVNDADGDGKLSDPGEVFGSGAGDGFGELAAMDADGNGWIDEGDPVFGRLRLRMEDGALVGLGALGIGALSTAGAAGEFQYKNEANELVAVVRRSGVYLNEDGSAGALRQIDLVM